MKKNLFNRWQVVCCSVVTFVLFLFCVEAMGYGMIIQNLQAGQDYCPSYENSNEGDPVVFESCGNTRAGFKAFRIEGLKNAIRFTDEYSGLSIGVDNDGRGILMNALKNPEEVTLWLKYDDQNDPFYRQLATFRDYEKCALVNFFYAGALLVEDCVKAREMQPNGFDIELDDIPASAN